MLGSVSSYDGRVSQVFAVYKCGDRVEVFGLNSADWSADSYLASDDWQLGVVESSKDSGRGFSICFEDSDYELNVRPRRSPPAAKIGGRCLSRASQIFFRPKKAFVGD